MSKENLRGDPDPRLTQRMGDGVDHRTFMMGSAVISSAAVISGCAAPGPASRAASTPPADEPLPADLDVDRTVAGDVPVPCLQPMTTPFEDLTPEDREQIQALWVRQYLAKLRGASGGGRRKTDWKLS
jgi:hypothetical protein